MKPTVGSLFAGIGGIDLGLERAGFQTKWQVEIDDYARKVLQRHFPAAERFRDVKQFPPKPDSAWLLHRWKERFSVDILAAGFPCQDISYAGKGAGLKGERSGLFYEVIRIIRVLGPELVLLENVSALLTRGLDQVLGTLASIGYDAEWHCIPAAYVGAPHIRDRVFILAYSKRCGMLKRSKVDKKRGRKDETEQNRMGCCCKILADTKRERQQGQGQPIDTCCKAEKGERQAVGIINGSIRQEWCPEPDLGRTIDGFSTWLDGSGLIVNSHKSIMAYGDMKGAINANEKKERACEILRALRNKIGKEDIQWEARGLLSIPATAVLFAYLRKLEERCTDEAWLFMEGKKASGKGMRSVRPANEPECTPHRSRHSKQSKRKHPDALQTLSRLLALDSEKAWARYRRENATAVRNWESGVARVADGVPFRVDRLRGLGNAVVPQVAEYIGRQIIHSLNRRGDVV